MPATGGARDIADVCWHGWPDRFEVLALDPGARLISTQSQEIYVCIVVASMRYDGEGRRTGPFRKSPDLSPFVHQARLLRKPSYRGRSRHGRKRSGNAQAPCRSRSLVNGNDDTPAQAPQRPVDGRSPGRVIRVQHAPHFALGNAELASEATP